MFGPFKEAAHTFCLIQLFSTFPLQVQAEFNHNLGHNKFVREGQ
jgi:hypothetical protein